MTIDDHASSEASQPPLSSVPSSASGGPKSPQDLALPPKVSQVGTPHSAPLTPSAPAPPIPHPPSTKSTIVVSTGDTTSKLFLTRHVCFFVVLPTISVIVMLIIFFFLPHAIQGGYTSPMDNGKPVIAPSRHPKANGGHDLERSRFRLPPELKPMLYIITLQTFLPFKPGVDFGERNNTVAGELILNFECHATTSSLFLHNNNIYIYNNTIRIADQELEKPRDIKLAWIEQHNHMMKMVVHPPMQQGHNYTLKLKFNTRFNHNSEGGFFHDVYVVGNETRYTGATQMQPNEARRVFPCMDEPSLKAHFQINVIHPNGTIALHNTKPVNQTRLNNSFIHTEFERTPLMSTYLLAIVICDYGYIETMYNNVTIRVYAQPKILPYTREILDLFKASLTFFENYFGIKYMLNKLDFVIVSSLRVTAMENWGLIIGNEKIIMDSNKMGYNQNFVASTTIIHEVAHTWFGNLVTMKWWNDLWLNEGFASYMSYFAMYKAKLYNFDTITQLVTNAASTMNQENRFPDMLSPEINEKFNRTIFNKIVYNKAAQVINMIENAIGEELFQSSMRTFILQHLYGNADSGDLALTISQTYRSHNIENPFGYHGFGEFLRTWTQQKGYPLVTMTRINSTSVGLHQMPYSQMLPSNDPPHDTLWIIPITYKTKFSDPNSKLLVYRQNDTGDFDTVIIPNVALINTKGAGYYHVLYDNETFEGIVHQLHTDMDSIPESARISLVYNYMSHTIISLVPLKTQFRLLEYIKNEHSHFVFTIVKKLFILQKSFLIDASFYDNFLIKFVHDRFVQVIIRNENIREHDIRSKTILPEILMQMLCDIKKYNTCIDFVFQKFEEYRQICPPEVLWSECSSTLDTIEMRKQILSFAVLHGNESYFDYVFEKFKMETDVVVAADLDVALRHAHYESSVRKMLTIPQKKHSILTCAEHFPAVQPILPFLMNFFKPLRGICVKKYIRPPISLNLSTLDGFEEFSKTYPRQTEEILNDAKQGRNYGKGFLKLNQDSLELIKNEYAL